MEKTFCTLLSGTILDIVLVNPLPAKIGCTGWKRTVPPRVALARRNNTVQSNGNIVLCKCSMRVDPLLIAKFHVIDTKTLSRRLLCSHPVKVLLQLGQVLLQKGLLLVLDLKGLLLVLDLKGLVLDLNFSLV